jgi:hypothetical protein
LVRDKGMPKGWLYNWEGIATMGNGTQRDVSAEGFLDFCLCVSSLSLIDAQKTVPAPIRG